MIKGFFLQWSFMRLNCNTPMLLVCYFNSLHVYGHRNFMLITNTNDSVFLNRMELFCPDIMALSTAFTLVSIHKLGLKPHLN